MPKTRVFISFDYDHDESQKHLLVGQSKLPDSPFELTDWSSKEHLTGDWKEKIKAKLRYVDVMCVLCGKNMTTATGVAHEVAIAQELKLPYFFLAAYSGGGMTKPTTAKVSDNVYSWTWDNLKKLIGGGR
ncbi:MAG: TIR domain-containing protein [Betaproteobacteria bacterium]